MHSDKTLLVIEDDIRFSKVLTKIANKKGYHTLTALSGRDGLLMVKAYNPDAVILDLILPDMDGLKVLEDLKNDISTRHIPVHVISAKDNKEVDSVKKGAIGYLTKPVSAEQLDSMFASVVNLSRDSIKRIFVVEDDVKTQKAISKLLNNKSVEIITIDKGQQGLKHIKNEIFDCIILDLQLPDMTGFEFLEKLEKLNTQKLPPVIIYTARQLTKKETLNLERYTGSIIIKGAHSPERLIDEVTLFLHSVESSLSEEQRKIISMQHNLHEPLKSKKVLLVDDDMRNVFAISKMLKSKDMEVIVAENGEVALQKIEEEENIAIIIMDIMMPVMDGYEAIIKIRQHDLYSTVPIIALTARTMSNEREKCLNAGANDYLAKPVDIEILFTLMRVLLFNNRLENIIDDIGSNDG